LNFEITKYDNKSDLLRTLRAPLLFCTRCMPTILNIAFAKNKNYRYCFGALVVTTPQRRRWLSIKSIGGTPSSDFFRLFGYRTVGVTGTDGFPGGNVDVIFFLLKNNKTRSNVKVAAVFHVKYRNCYRVSVCVYSMYALANVSIHVRMVHIAVLT